MDSTKIQTKKNSCKLCGWIQQGSQHERFLFETDAVIAFVGEHQFYPGYIVLISKIHVREIFELSPQVQDLLFKDLSKASKIVARLTSPSKINLASLGNVEEHLHWHIFPRSPEEANTHQHPWFNADQFEQFSTSSEDILRIRTFFEQNGA